MAPCLKVAEEYDIKLFNWTFESDMFLPFKKIIHGKNYARSGCLNWNLIESLPDLFWTELHANT